MAIRVIIVDDHDMLRMGVAMLIKEHHDVEVIGEVSNGADAIQLCMQLRPDVVLMDLVMPGMDGITAIRTLRQLVPETQIIALSTFYDEGRVHSAIRAGAISYLLKNVSGIMLADAIRQAVQGKSILSPEAAQALVNFTYLKELEDFALTRREHEVLKLLVKGYTNLQIASHLTVSHATAKKHVGNILRKFGTNSRTEAVAVALQKKLVAL